MKQDDWLEACREIDALNAQLAAKIKEHGERYMEWGQTVSILEAKYQKAVEALAKSTKLMRHWSNWYSPLSPTIQSLQNTMKFNEQMWAQIKKNADLLPNSAEEKE